MKWFELLMPVLNVVYVVIAIVMVGLILMQRGAGAQAGSGFGSGASGTVFGARGSANFLSRATAVCALMFFLISIGMGMAVSHGGRLKPAVDAGIMSGFTPEAVAPPVKAGEVPVAPTVPAGAPAAVTPVPAAADPTVPVVSPDAEQAVPEVPAEQAAPKSETK